MSKVLDVLWLSKQRTKLVSPLASCDVFSCVAGSSVGQKKRNRVFRHQSIGRCGVCFCRAARAASSSSSASAARSCCSSLANACASNFWSTNFAGGGRVGVSRTKQLSLPDNGSDEIVGVVAVYVSSSVFNFLAPSVDLYLIRYFGQISWWADCSHRRLTWQMGSCAFGLILLLTTCTCRSHPHRLVGYYCYCYSRVLRVVFFSVSAFVV